jgi:hypothetical protein
MKALFVGGALIVTLTIAWAIPYCIYQQAGKIPQDLHDILVVATLVACCLYIHKYV